MKRTLWIGMLVGVGACGGKQGTTLPATRVLDLPNENVQTVAYSPDGTRIAYVAPGPSGAELVIAPADLSASRVLDSVGLVPPFLIWSPDGRRLAYGVLESNGLEAAIMTLDSVTPHRREITHSPGIHIPYQWHPSGRRLAYASTGPGTFVSDVYSLATGTSEPMIEGVRQAVGAWSPNGSRIAYTLRTASDSGGFQTTVWLADSTGRRGRQLTHEGHETLPGVAGGTPWSPDGKSILYVSNRTGKHDIWVWSLTADSARQLTYDVLDDDNPVWSPDGRWVLFLSHRTRQTDLWIVPAAGGTPRRVTDTPAPESDPAWVPGTHAVTYTVDHGSTGLWMRSLDDSTERRITPDSIHVGGWDLSPDGRRIAFQLSHKGVTDLAVVPVAGGETRTLVTDVFPGQAPEWSPDGSRILYLAKPSRRQRAWVVDSAGRAPHPITSWPGNDQGARWSHDGSAAYVASTYETNGALGNTVWRVPIDGGTPRRVSHVSGTAIMGVQTSPYSDDVFVIGLGGQSGGINAYVLQADGTLRTLWNRTAVMQFDRRGFDPSGDSVMIEGPSPDGGARSMLISTATGEGHPMPDIDQRDFTALDWAPDGRRLLFAFGQGQSKPDLAVYDRTTEKVTVLTHTPKAAEPDARWLPDGRHIVFSRSVGVSQVLTADLTELMAGGK